MSDINVAKALRDMSDIFMPFDTKVAAQLAILSAEATRQCAEHGVLMNALQDLINVENSVETFEGDDPAYSLIKVESINYMDEAVERAEKALDSVSDTRGQDDS